MKNKKTRMVKGILLCILLVLGGMIWGILTVMGRSNLKEQLEETLSAAKIRLQSYENYMANDRVKSLVRLLDKTEELGNNLMKSAHYDQTDLDTYVSEQRLSGAFVTDADLQIIKQSVADTEINPLWAEISGKEYVKELLAHPEETYSERINSGSTEYDLAIVHRRDADGLVVAYARKDGKTFGDLTIEAVFADSVISMHGSIIVYKDDVVVSSNRSELCQKTSQELETYFKSSLHEDKNGMITVHPQKQTWYGGKDRMGEYMVCVFFPSSQVYMTRTVVISVYVVLAILLHLLIMLVQSNTEKAALKQNQKRMRIINALGTAYYTV